MGVMYGVNPTWAAQTNAGRTHIATKGVVQSGLVLNLDAGASTSYPGSGTVWTDLSGNGNTGTLTNGPTFNSANGGSLVFDGIDDRVTFASNPSLTNQITVEVWVNLNSTTPNGTAWILGRESSYRLLYGSSSFQWVCATVNNGWYTTGTFAIASVSATSGIYQVVGTYDGSNNRIYVNGTLITTGSSISGNISGGQNYVLFLSNVGGIDYGKGNLYSHKLYNRALTASEISQNYNALKSRYI
jgi:hypothetical protein